MKLARRPSEANMFHTLYRRQFPFKQLMHLPILSQTHKMPTLPLTLTKKLWPPPTLKLLRLTSLPSSPGYIDHSSQCSWETGQQSFQYTPAPLSTLLQLDGLYHTLTTLYCTNATHKPLASTTSTSTTPKLASPANPRSSIIQTYYVFIGMRKEMYNINQKIGSIHE